MGPFARLIYGGVSSSGSVQETVSATQGGLERWGRWLKRRRPRVAIESIGSDLIIGYIASCTSFRPRATVYGTLSHAGFCDLSDSRGTAEDQPAPLDAMPNAGVRLGHWIWKSLKFRRSVCVASSD